MRYHINFVQLIPVIITTTKLKACENPEEIELFYTNVRGDTCSRCPLSNCSGCRVPENYEIELKQYDNFKVMTITRFDSIQVKQSTSYRNEYLMSFLNFYEARHNYAPYFYKLHEDALQSLHNIQ